MVGVAGCRSTGSADIDFVKDVKPVLEQRCVICHNSESMPGKPSFETRGSATQPGPRGVPIVPGNPEASRMIAVIELGEVDEQAMPPVSHRVSPSEQETLRSWIAQGAPWPADSSGKLVPPFKAME